MAEPTLKDVLNAIATLRAKTKKDVAEVVLATRQELNERFDALDEKVEIVRDMLISTRRDTGDLRDDVTAIHKGLVRAKTAERRQDPRDGRRRVGRWGTHVQG